MMVLIKLFLEILFVYVGICPVCACICGVHMYVSIYMCMDVHVCVPVEGRG